MPSDNIEDLIQSQTKTYNDVRHLIDDDLRKVIQAERAGKKRPTFRKMAEFFARKHRLTIYPATLHTSYQRLSLEAERSNDE